MKTASAEIFGTAVLVFVGCGAATLGGHAGLLPIALAFGVAIVAAAYSIGSVSGAHLNPAVTLSMVTAGRMELKTGLMYMVSQVVGAFVGAGFLALIISLMGKTVGGVGMGQTVYAASTGMNAAALLEFVTTFIFITVILGVTRSGANNLAGLVIGLTLAALILVAGGLTGMSANPARSLAPAVYVGGDAMAQVWMYIIVTFAAGFAAGLVEKMGLLRKD